MKIIRDNITQQQYNIVITENNSVQIEITNEDYRLVLYNSSGRMLMSVKKTDNLISAKTELEAILGS